MYDVLDPSGLQRDTALQVTIDEITQGVRTIEDPATGDVGGGGGAIPVTSIMSTDNFLAVTTPSTNARELARGSAVGDLWDKDPAAAVADPPTLTAAGLPIGAAYSQSEIVALRDALITLSDKVIEELAALRAAGIQAT